MSFKTDYRLLITNYSLLFIFIISATPLTAQRHFTTACGGYKVSYNSGNFDYFGVVDGCPFTPADTGQFPAPIRAEIRSYLLNRVGPAFYQRLQYSACQIIKPNTDKTCLSRAQYAIQYYFEVEDSMRYYIALVMDLNGNLLSRHMLPDVKRNPNFANIINLCDAFAITQADTFKIANQVLSLQYSDTKNAFVWVAATSLGNKYSNATKPPYLTINAQTGIVFKRIVNRFNFIRDYGQ